MKNLASYYSQSIKMKAEFAKKSTEVEKNKLVAEFVESLRREGLNDDEIKTVLNIERLTEAQNSRQMISAREDYKAAVAKALGRTK